MLAVGVFKFVPALHHVIDHGDVEIAVRFLSRLTHVYAIALAATCAGALLVWNGLAARRAFRQAQFDRELWNRVQHLEACVRELESHRSDDKI